MVKHEHRANVASAIFQVDDAETLVVDFKRGASCQPFHFRKRAVIAGCKFRELVRRVPRFRKRID